MRDRLASCWPNENSAALGGKLHHHQVGKKISCTCHYWIGGSKTLCSVILKSPMVNNWVWMHTEQPTAVQFYLKCGQEDCFSLWFVWGWEGGGVRRTAGETNGGMRIPTLLMDHLLFIPLLHLLHVPHPSSSPFSSLLHHFAEGGPRGQEKTKTGRIKEHLSSHLQPVCYRTTKSISLYGISDYLVLTGGEDNWEEGQKWITPEIDLTWVDSLHKVRSTFLLDCLQPLTYLTSWTTE